MKLQFKHQKFQEDAAKAVVDVFAGQPYRSAPYRMEQGAGSRQASLNGERDFTGWSNAAIVPELSDGAVLEHIRRIQREHQIEPSEKLEGRYNLTIEMETGVGKTYTYIKTIYELNRHYGWSKFIIVVPSIAVREGVYQSLQATQEHFAEEYGKKIRFFIYSSARLEELEHFAMDSSIRVMIINSQAFNARGKEARRIYMELDGFRSRRPVDVIAETNPILIIDEPQSVEGKQTRERLKEFHPLMTLRYSATHRDNRRYNMIYRLDALDAYNMRLVKKISVKGISESGSAAAEGYVYLESVRLSASDPKAALQFDCRGANGIRKITRRAGVGFNLYDASGELEEYRDGFVVKSVDGRDNSVEFLNGIKIHAGEVLGKASVEQLRRIQIRETILSHLEKERRLFYRGIKVLSLFFIDEVASYKRYSADGQPYNGIYADMFEEEYAEIIEHMKQDGEKDAYWEYLKAIPADKTHAGYFSIDKKGRYTDGKAGEKSGRVSDDTDAYDLIMKNKERLLDQDPVKSPVRFIFSHSALREGWDNPNVFQICTLKQSSSDVRKRQEVGRGLRLCVNQAGERMDAGILGEEVHRVNVLTVIASESYDSFARGLQTELAEAASGRPQKVTEALFAGKVVEDAKGRRELNGDTARAVCFELLLNGYVDKNGCLTDKYYADRENHSFQIAGEASNWTEAVIRILDSVRDGRAMRPENAREKNVRVKIDREKLEIPEFRELWERIRRKSAYAVCFDEEELVKKSVASLNRNLRVPKICFQVETGTMERIQSREALLDGKAFVRESLFFREEQRVPENPGVKYDLIGELAEKTGLTRRAAAGILTGIEKTVFGQWKDNPEQFIRGAAALVNEEKAAAVIRHISYEALEETYDTGIFTEFAADAKLGVNAMKAERHLYDYVVYESAAEKEFAEALEANEDVAVYVKLPKSFFISTPVGRYTPGWAVAFRKGTVKQAYFVAETKKGAPPAQTRMAEQAKIQCAREHFKAVGGEEVAYDAVEGYEKLMEKAMEERPEG